MSIPLQDLRKWLTLSESFGAQEWEYWGAEDYSKRSSKILGKNKDRESIISTVLSLLWKWSCFAVLFEDTGEIRIELDLEFNMITQSER